VTPHQALLACYVENHPDEVARRCDGLTDAAVAAVLAAMDEESAAGLLRHLAPAQAATSLGALDAEKGAAVLTHLPADVASSLLRQLDPRVADALIELLPADHAIPVRVLLSYAPASAGGVMDPLVLTAPLSATVDSVRTLVGRYPDHLYYYVYVVDDEHRLVGVVDLAELFQATPTEAMRSVMHAPVSALPAESPLEAVFAHPAWRTFDALPVVTSDRTFVGAIRHRRMRQLLATHKPAAGREPGVQTVMALGEIYWLGLCGLLQGIASTASEPAPVRGERS
jgi:magnesium transporter